MDDKKLEEIIYKYKELNDKNHNRELEIRFTNVDYLSFKSIYEKLYESAKNNAIDILFTQTLNAIMTVTTGNDKMPINNIRTKYFNGQVSTKEEYSSKTTISISPEQDSFGISYKVILSLETPNIKPFILDENAIIRFKNRVSFIEEEAGIKWRIDMTIVRQTRGSEINSVKNIKKQMFDSTVTPETLLNIFNDTKVSQNIYKYEIEAELLNKENYNKDVTANEHIKPIDIKNMAKKIIYIANPNYLLDMLLHNKILIIAKILKVPTFIQKQKKIGLRRILPKVQALTRYDYNLLYQNLYQQNDLYFITDKADGERAVGMCKDNIAYILTTEIKEFKIMENQPETIVDAEYIESINTLYIFDVIMCNGIDISNMPFESRKLSLNSAAETLKKFKINVEVKPYLSINITNLKEKIEETYNRPNRPYNIDGLIFVKSGENYVNTKSYKWKDIKHNTIDFLVKKVPQSVLNSKKFPEKNNYTMYFLFVGITYDLFKSLGLRTCYGYDNIFEDNKLKQSGAYFPIQFSPSIAPLAYIYYHPNITVYTNEMLDNKIIEFRCVNNCTATNGPIVEWQIVKIRTDRQYDVDSKTYYGNDYRIAEITYINYLDQFPLEQLYKNNEEGQYFMGNKPKMYEAQTAVISYVKSKRISNFNHYNWIVDIGCGRGADLKRYFDANVKNLIAIDSDKAAIAELIRRKHIFANDNSIIKKSTNIYAVLADMTTKYEDILATIYSSIEDIQPNSIDCIICNLSIHYYIYTSELLQNFINFVDNMLKVNGSLVITCFFGKEVFNLLKDLNEGQIWSSYEDCVLKYSIKKMYSSNMLENMGQKIEVIHPFSRGNYYEEYLINIDFLINEFSKYNYKVTVNNNISNKIINSFKSSNSNMAIKLTKNDELYLSLYGELILTKK
jgi:hypothetical protein